MSRVPFQVLTEFRVLHAPSSHSTTGHLLLGLCWWLPPVVCSWKLFRATLVISPLSGLLPWSPFLSNEHLLWESRNTLSLLVLLWLWEQLYWTGFQLLEFLLELFILQQRARHSLKTNVIMRALLCHLICSQSPPKGPTSPHHQYVTLRIWLLTWTLQWYIKLNYTSYTSSFNSQFPVIPARVIESLVQGRIVRKWDWACVAELNPSSVNSQPGLVTWGWRVCSGSGRFESVL